MRLRVIFVSCAILTALAACNEVPVRDLNESYSVQVQVLRDKGKPAKLDVLWVVDDSTSMCQEQQSLAESFKAFLNVFQQYTAIDMRLAVTTTNVCTPSDSNPVRGKFVYRPNIAVDSECVETRRFPCVEAGIGGADSCSKMKGVKNPENWRCKVPASPNPIDPIPTYICDAPPDNEIGVNDPFEGYALESYSSSCVYTCDPNGEGTECVSSFGMPDSCEEGGAICNVGCDQTNCLNDVSLDDFNDCSLRCRDRDCQEVCVEMTGNAADCANRCQAQDANCEDVCGVIQKLPKCDATCGSLAGEDKCEERCVRYLGQSMTAACGNMCGSGVSEASCIDQCLDSHEGMSNAGFLCLMVCRDEYNCQNSCINEFGVSNYQCICPGGNCDNVGCARVPRWMYCPGTMKKDANDNPVWTGGPTILDKDEADRWAVKWINGEWTAPPDWDPEWKNLPTDDSDESVEARKLLTEKVFEQLFTCMTSVVMSQGECGGQEQGLLAAFMALDKDGENAQQARDFLRDDAYLLIVVISDEDDCSSPEYADGTKWYNYAGQQDNDIACACMRDEYGCLPSGDCDYSQCLDTNGTFSRRKCPLYSTSTMVNKLRSLKPDPAQVLFAAIVGDAQPGSKTSPEATEQEIRDRFFECRCYSERGILARKYNYICSSNYGVAEFGRRYIDVVEAFGIERYGQKANICSDTGVAPALEQIADLVVPLLTQVCLPRPLEWDCQGRCENIFDDNVAACAEACQDDVGLPRSIDDCMDKCDEVFEGRPGCADMCRAAKQIEVRRYNGDGSCAVALDGNGECPALNEIVGAGDGDFSLVRNSPACPMFDVENGERPENAIQFPDPLGYTDKLEIIYRASSGFCYNRCSGYFNQDLDDEKFCLDVCGKDTDYCVRNCLIDGDYCPYICNVVVDDCLKMCNTMIAECETNEECEAAGLEAASCNERCRMP